MKTPEEWADLLHIPCECRFARCRHRVDAANLLLKAIAEAVAAERDACACLAEDIWRDSTGSGSQVAAMIVNAIRVRTL